MFGNKSCAQSKKRVQAEIGHLFFGQYEICLIAMVAVILQFDWFLSLTFFFLLFILIYNSNEYVWSPTALLQGAHAGLKSP